MKLIVLLGIIAVAAAGALPPIAILQQTMEFNEGSYKHSFESANGIKVEESGQEKQITPEESGMTSRGSYSYTAPDGTLIKVDWVADENGFQPSGAHLPVAPPMPPHVVKLLADLKAAGKL